MTSIIAEAGVNHNGDKNLALQLIEEAANSGADFVKFQTFKASELVTPQAEMAAYQARNLGTRQNQFEMLKNLELSYDTHFELVDYCKQQNIGFLSSAFDYDSLQFLIEDLGLPQLKIASGEITNLPFLLAHAHSDCRLILSTGMSTLADIEQALATLAFGLITEKRARPSLNAIMEAYACDEGQRALAEKITLLHCTSEYPAPVDEINLNAIHTMKQAFGLPVGYSDHSDGIIVPVAAAAVGACMLEKHFTLDRNLPGPDHKASLEPSDLKKMVNAVRMTERAMGMSVKLPTRSELETIKVGRKSLVADQSIKQGEVFSPANLAVKRPGTGVAPKYYWQYLGRVASRDYQAGELIVE